MGATVPVRAGLLVESVSKVTSSHSLLDCCLDGVFQDGCFPSGSCSDILRGCDLCEQYRQSHLPLAWSSALLQGYWVRTKNQELKIHVVCSHTATPQGCSQCPVTAVLGSGEMQECLVCQLRWAGNQSLAWDIWKFGGCFYLCLARPCVD